MVVESEGSDFDVVGGKAFLDQTEAISGGSNQGFPNASQNVITRIIKKIESKKYSMPRVEKVFLKFSVF